MLCECCVGEGEALEGEALELWQNATADADRAIAHAQQLAAAATATADIAATTGAALDYAQERLSRLRALNASLHGETVCLPCDAPLPPWAVEGGGKRGPTPQATIQANKKRWDQWRSPAAAHSSSAGCSAADASASAASAGATTGGKAAFTSRS